MLRRCAWHCSPCCSAPGHCSPAQYFGQNKVQYSRSISRSSRPSISTSTYYERERAAAMDAARMAERSYARLSRVLKHEFHERKPIIVYASHADFPQTNAHAARRPAKAPAASPTSSTQRMMPLHGLLRGLRARAQHEMVHQFQYDIWSRAAGPARASRRSSPINPPLWFVGGHGGVPVASGRSTPQDRHVAAGRGAQRQAADDRAAEERPRVFPYRFGHALWRTSASGGETRRSARSCRGLWRGGDRRRVPAHHRRRRSKLSDQWRDAVQKQYLPEVGAAERPRAVAARDPGPEAVQGHLHLAPALSPDGTQVAYFSESDFFFVDLYLADAHTGKVEAAAAQVRPTAATTRPSASSTRRRAGRRTGSFSPSRPSGGRGTRSS